MVSENDIEFNVKYITLQTYLYKSKTLKCENEHFIYLNVFITDYVDCKWINI